MALQSLRRQKQTVESILAENRRLRDQILEETRFGQESGGRDVGDVQTLIAALEARDLSHEAFIAQEQRAVEELIAREEELREEIRKVRLAMGGVFNAKEQWVLRQRRIVLLENQVSQALTGCDTLETSVKQLVREIDGLRKEKVLFNQLQQKMERSFQSKAQHIGELLFLASNAHKSKRRAERLLERVQLQTDKETAAYMDEWRRLERVLQDDADCRERKFLESCAQRSQRLEAVLAKKRGRRKKAVDCQSEDRPLENKRLPVKSPKERLVHVEALLAQIVEGLPGTLSHIVIVILS